MARKPSSRVKFCPSTSFSNHKVAQPTEISTTRIHLHTTSQLIPISNSRRWNKWIKQAIKSRSEQQFIERKKYPATGYQIHRPNSATKGSNPTPGKTSKKVGATWSDNLRDRFKNKSKFSQSTGIKIDSPIPIQALASHTNFAGGGSQLGFLKEPKKDWPWPAEWWSIDRTGEIVRNPWERITRATAFCCRRRRQVGGATRGSVLLQDSRTRELDGRDVRSHHSTLCSVAFCHLEEGRYCGRVRRI